MFPHRDVKQSTILINRQSKKASDQPSLTHILYMMCKLYTSCTVYIIEFYKGCALSKGIFELIMLNNERKSQWKCIVSKSLHKFLAGLLIPIHTSFTILIMIYINKSIVSLKYVLTMKRTIKCLFPLKNALMNCLKAGNKVHGEMIQRSNLNWRLVTWPKTLLTTDLMQMFMYADTKLAVDCAFIFISTNTR